MNSENAYNDSQHLLCYNIVMEILHSFGGGIAFSGGESWEHVISDGTISDAAIKSSKLYSDLIEEITKVGEKLIDHKYSTGFRIKEKVTNKTTGGFTVYGNSGEKVLRVIMSWRDYTPNELLLEFSFFHGYEFDVEKVLADKLITVLTSGKVLYPSDLYDIYCISNCFDFSADTIFEYITLSADESGVNWQAYPFNDEIILKYSQAYNKLIIYDPVLNEQRELPLFRMVLSRFNTICDALLHRKGVIWDHKLAIFKRI